MQKIFKTAFLSLFLLGAMISPSAAETLLSEEQARKIVQPFYDLLSRKASMDEAKQVFHPEWQSFYSETGSKGRDKTISFIGGPLAKMIPDLNWEIKSVSVTTKNEIIVRSEASGTPVGETFRGRPIDGKSFKIMTIDIHHPKDGKIIKSYHIEDWARAFQQLAPAPKK